MPTWYRVGGGLLHTRNQRICPQDWLGDHNNHGRDDRPNELWKGSRVDTIRHVHADVPKATFDDNCPGNQLWTQQKTREDDYKRGDHQVIWYFNSNYKVRVRFKSITLVGSPTIQVYSHSFVGENRNVSKLIWYSVFVFAIQQTPRGTSTQHAKRGMAMDIGWRLR